MLVREKNVSNLEKYVKLIKPYQTVLNLVKPYQTLWLIAYHILFYTVNQFTPKPSQTLLKLIEYNQIKSKPCQIWSNLVKPCQIFTNLDKPYQILSNTINSRQNLVKPSYNLVKPYIV